MTAASMWTWMTPALFTLVLYGIGQGLVKKYISEVPPARFCLYFVVAKAFVNLWYFATTAHPDPFAAGGRDFLMVGTGAYILDGIGWILYFQSIVAGPIAIVGTLSAAYPALTVLFAKFFLGEQLSWIQYLGVFLVIAGCLGLSYTPPEKATKKTKASWVPMAFGALLIWGASQTLVKYSYKMPEANDANLALFNTIGGFLTLGLFGLIRGLPGKHTMHGWAISFFPMAMMAAGDLGVILALRTGPASIVTPLTGAYPLVTLGFAYVALKEKVSKLQWVSVILILAGIVMSPGAS
ncbi:MAG: DMT family transporter [Bdellovibrionales bacterium]|nr:DMT family transporter [Bdellovibrionales bacterium]